MPRATIRIEPSPTGTPGSALRAQGFDYLPQVPSPSGVYALLLKGIVVYVGQSENIYRRISTHMVSRKYVPFRAHFSVGDIRARGIPFDTVLVKWVSVEELNRVERELILQLRPKYNQKILRRVPPRVKVDLLSLGLMERRGPGEVRRRRVA